MRVMKRCPTTRQMALVSIHLLDRISKERRSRRKRGREDGEEAFKIQKENSMHFILILNVIFGATRIFDK